MKITAKKGLDADVNRVAVKQFLLHLNEAIYKHNKNC